MCQCSVPKAIKVQFSGKWQNIKDCAHEYFHFILHPSLKLLYWKNDKKTIVSKHYKIYANIIRWQSFEILIQFCLLYKYNSSLESWGKSPILVASTCTVQKRWKVKECILMCLNGQTIALSYKKLVFSLYVIALYCLILLTRLTHCASSIKLFDSRGALERIDAWHLS